LLTSDIFFEPVFPPTPGLEEAEGEEGPGGESGEGDGEPVSYWKWKEALLRSSTVSLGTGEKFFSGNCCQTQINRDSDILLQFSHSPCQVIGEGGEPKHRNKLENRTFLAGQETELCLEGKEQKFDWRTGNRTLLGGQGTELCLEGREQNVAWRAGNRTLLGGQGTEQTALQREK